MGTPKSTSSLASEDGPTPSGSPDGQTTDQFGLAPVPVSRFRALDSGKAMPIDDISGPLFTASSPSAALQRSLESRLRARMAGSGSPLYVLTWRRSGYACGCADLAAASVGAPHIRQRLFWVADGRTAKGEVAPSQSIGVADSENKRFGESTSRARMDRQGRQKPRDMRSSAIKLH